MRKRHEEEKENVAGISDYTNSLLPATVPNRERARDKERKRERESERERVRELEEAPFWVVQKTDR